MVEHRTCVSNGMAILNAIPVIRQFTNGQLDQQRILQILSIRDGCGRMPIVHRGGQVVPRAGTGTGLPLLRCDMTSAIASEIAWGEERGREGAGSGGGGGVGDGPIPVRVTQPAVCGARWECSRDHLVWQDALLALLPSTSSSELADDRVRVYT
jgi:hypothetical protein